MTPIPRLREEPLFFDVFAEPWQQIKDVEIARGLDVQVASRYRDGRGFTLVAALPAGWRGVERAVDGTLEAFVLEGELTVPCRTVPSGGFVQIPRGAGPVDLSSAAGARVVLFWHATMPDLYGQGWRVTTMWDEPWIATEIEDFPPGTLHKTLRVPDAQVDLAAGTEAGFLRVVTSAGGWLSPNMEKHACWEENILLRGDMLMPMPGRGVLRPGTNLANPEHFWHGPMTTKGGTLFLVNCDAPMDVVYRDHPGGEETLRQYLAEAPW